MNDHQRGYNAYRNMQLGAAIVDSSIKGYQAGKYAALAYHGYKLGKKFVNSFSQKENMAPTGRKRAGSSNSRIAKKPLAIAGPSTPRTPVKLYHGPRPGTSGGGTPRYVIRGQAVKRKGASMSKSMGRFRKGTRKLQTLDRMATRGVVYCLEYGGVVEDSTAPYSQAVTVGHANYTQFTINAQVAMALTKMVSLKMGLQLESFDENIKATGDGYFKFGLTYKANTIGGSLYVEYNTNLGAQWINLARWFFERLNLRNNSTEWIQLEVFETYFQGVNAVAQSKRCAIDLTKARVQLYAKSSLKI